MITGLKQAVGATAAMFIIIGALILTCGGLSLLGLWAAGEFSAPAGAINQKIQTNSAENRTEAQYQFGSDYQAVQTDVANIQQDTDAYYQQGQSNYLLSVVTSDQHTCRDDVATYNTLAAGTTTSPWRPAADPVSINASTECKMPPEPTK